MEKVTMSSLVKTLRTEADAYRFLESKRWPDGPICPHCKTEGGHYYLRPKSGLTTAEGTEARRTRTGSVTGRRLWKCKSCRKQFSVTTGTIMHGSKVDLRVWVLVIFEMCANRNGIAAREIERRYGVASRTAWFMTQRIRAAMDEWMTDSFDGDVIADETYIGGEPENRHADKRGPKVTGRATKKTPVFALINARTGEVRSRVIPDVTARTLRRAIAENCDMPFTTLHSDSLNAYRVVGAYMEGHHAVNHNDGEYVTDKSFGTQKAENFFSQLKRSINGTHHHVSREHLHRYLAEFDFRHSTHKETDSWRMGLLMSLLGDKRLTYKLCAAR
jgi:transposase-like protein